MLKGQISESQLETLNSSTLEAESSELQVDIKKDSLENFTSSLNNLFWAKFMPKFGGLLCTRAGEHQRPSSGSHVYSHQCLQTL